MVGGCFYLGVPSLTENVPGPARRDRFRLIDAHTHTGRNLVPVAERVWYVKGRRAERKAGSLR